MNKKRQIIVILLLYFCIVAMIITADYYMLSGRIVRGFLAFFVHDGMEPSTIVSLLGAPQRDVGSGITIMQWDLLFHSQLTIGISNETVLYHQTFGSPMFNALLFPALLVLIALVEVTVFYIVKKCRTH